uniref:Uncharacterized protein n=1 Tax=Anguilla anguilla TaxID=7936 RepID=A0A0E9P5A4_ANGAN
MFILCVLNPSKGSSTRLVARSSVSHSSRTLILLHPSISFLHPHTDSLVSMLLVASRPKTNVRITDSR